MHQKSKLEKLIESMHEILPISISNVLSNFLYPFPIYSYSEYSIIPLEKLKDQL